MEMMDMERREIFFFFLATFRYPQKVLSLQAFRESVLYARPTNSSYRRLVFLYYSSRLHKPVRRKKEIDKKSIVNIICLHIKAFMEKNNQD